MKGIAMATANKARKARAGFRMANILVPTDFSEASLLAVEHAQGLAKLFGAQMHLVHVVPTMLPPEAGTEVGRLVQDAKQRFVRFLDEANIAWPEDQLHVSYGDLLEELSDYIGRHEIDLVVIGSSAAGGAKRLLMGSMAEYIFRSLEAPVLAMGPQASDPMSARHPLRHIVLCESLVPEAQRAMKYGCDLAEFTRAKVTVVHVLPESLKDSRRAVRFQQMFEDELRTGATHPEKFAEADYVVTFGDTAREVVRVANSVEADLIVLGAKPAEMWQTHMGRGTAFRILSNAHCPILSVRS